MTDLPDDDDAIVDANALETLIDDGGTLQAPAPEPPKTAPVVEGIEPLTVTLAPRFGYRKLRGKAAKVPTGHLDIRVDGRLHAWTRPTPGAPIRALAEFMPHEIPQLQAAVQAYTGEPELRPFRRNTTPTDAEIRSLEQL